MSSTYISKELRYFVRERAQFRCEYCQAQEIILGMPFEIEHIMPESQGGDSLEENLCLACPRCNRYKASQISIWDEINKAQVDLFNPRQQLWDEHFVWGERGREIQALTATGRVTIAALHLNNAFVVRARVIWVNAGWHPPAS